MGSLRRMLLAEVHALDADRRRHRRRGIAMLVAYVTAIVTCTYVRFGNREPASAGWLVTAGLALVAFCVATHELRAARRASARLRVIAALLRAT